MLYKDEALSQCQVMAMLKVTNKAAHGPLNNLWKLN